MNLLQIVSDKVKGTRDLKHFNYINRTFFGITIDMLNLTPIKCTVTYYMTIKK